MTNWNKGTVQGRRTSVQNWHWAADPSLRFCLFEGTRSLTGWSSVDAGCDRQPSDWLTGAMMQVWLILYSEPGDLGFWPFVSLVTTVMSSPLHAFIAVIILSSLSDPLRFVWHHKASRWRTIYMRLFESMMGSTRQSLFIHLFSPPHSLCWSS